MPSNAPFGFRPSRHLRGGVIRNAEYPIATNYSTKIHTGSPVKLLNDGTIALAAAGDRILGIFMGVQYTASDGSPVFKNYWDAPSSPTNPLAQVIDDPDVAYFIQSGGTPTSADVGQLADHVAGTANDFIGQSGAYLNSSTGTGSAAVRILGLAKFPGNSGQYAVLEVQPFEWELAYHGQGTIGI